jgi:hypothetical protein
MLFWSACLRDSLHITPLVDFIEGKSCTIPSFFSRLPKIQILKTMVPKPGLIFNCRGRDNYRFSVNLIPNFKDFHSYNGELKISFLLLYTFILSSILWHSISPIAEHTLQIVLHLWHIKHIGFV